MHVVTQLLIDPLREYPEIATGKGPESAYRLRESGIDFPKGYREGLTLREPALKLGFLTAKQFDE